MNQNIMSQNASQPSVVHPVLQAYDFLHEKYQFRTNSLTGRVEVAPCHPKGKQAKFRPVDRTVKNDLLLELFQTGIDVGSTSRLNAIIENGRACEYDPVETYLAGLPRWDGTDRIGAFFARLTDDEWERHVLHRALLATVEQMQGTLRPFGNSLCPILISQTQGWGKSQSIRRLLPPELRMLYTESFNLSKEDECLGRMTKFLLINLDEIDHIGATHLALLKQFIQMPNISLRKRYANWMETLPRRASFWATTNHTYVLHDLTGSRRFFPVRLKGIVDWKANPIDYPQFYAQALYELEEGRLKTWFTQEENCRIETHNRPYCAELCLQDLVNRIFERIGNDNRSWGDSMAHNIGLLTAEEIFSELVRRNPELMVCFSEKHFGATLKDLGATSYRTSKHRYYNLRLRVRG